MCIHKVYKNRLKLILLNLFLLSLLSSSCTNQQQNKNITQKAKKESQNKPPCSFQDSLKIEFNTAVFYQPDSVQKEKIKEVTDSRIFEGSMHEYFYQTKNAHIVLKKNWPKINIIEAKNKRYLVFVKEDKTNDIIDLDKFNDAYGLFIFDGKKKPVLVDMTNLDEALYFYFSK